MKLSQVRIMHCGSPNQNGITIPAAAMKEAIAAVEGGTIYGMLGWPEGASPLVNQMKVACIATNFNMDDIGCVFADIEFTETPHGQIAMEYPDKTFNINGLGKVNEGIVSEYQISSLSILPIWWREDPTDD